jgi:acylphosphatase
MKRLLHMYISGHVQGVCFRMSAREEMRALGVTGWVRNLPDGRVETEVEGEDAALEAYRQWCHRGPPAAIVEDVTATYASPTGARS